MRNKQRYYDQQGHDNKRIDECHAYVQSSVLTLYIYSIHLGSNAFLNLYINVPILQIYIFSTVNKEYLLNICSVDVYGGTKSINLTALFCIFTIGFKFLPNKLSLIIMYFSCYS